MMKQVCGKGGYASALVPRDGQHCSLELIAVIQLVNFQLSTVNSNGYFIATQLLLVEPQLRYE